MRRVAQERIAPPRGRETVGIDLAVENPLLTIWTRPRATIRGLVDAGAARRFLPLIIAAAIAFGILNELLQHNEAFRSVGARSLWRY